MLFALTNLHHLIGDSVQMTQRLFLDNQTFCLSFYYQARTDMTFKVKKILLCKWQNCFYLGSSFWIYYNLHPLLWIFYGICLFFRSVWNLRVLCMSYGILQTETPLIGQKPRYSSLWWSVAFCPISLCEQSHLLTSITNHTWLLMISASFLEYAQHMVIYINMCSKFCWSILVLFFLLQKK